MLISLSSYADRDGYAWPAIQTIADEIGCARETVSRALSVLASRGYVEKETTRQTGARRTRSYNTYRLVRDVQYDMFDGMKRDEGGHTDRDEGCHSEPPENVTGGVTRNVTNAVTQKYNREGNTPPKAPPEGGGNGPAVNRPDGRAGGQCEGAIDAPVGAASVSDGDPAGSRRLAGGEPNEKISPDPDADTLLQMSLGFRMRKAYAATWLAGVLKNLSPAEIAECMETAAAENLKAPAMRARVAERIAINKRAGEVADRAAKPAAPPPEDIAAWLAALDRLKAELPASAFSWIKRLGLAGPINGEAVLTAPSRAFADMVTAEPESLDQITAALAAERPGLSAVRIVTAGRARA